MIQNQRKLFALCKVNFPLRSNYFGTLPSISNRGALTKGKDDVAEDEIKKSVFISQSTNIYSNLALKEWMHKNFDFSRHHVLLVHRNDPCVTIGRNDNPWLECNVPGVLKNKIALARRNSIGSATGYQDLGHLNLTFFAPLNRLDTRYNLNIITRALFREWRLKALVDENDDITVQKKFKISDSCTRLEKNEHFENDYQSCTLLVDADKKVSSLALEKVENGLGSDKTTKSSGLPVKNLREVDSNVESDLLIKAVGWEFLRTKALTLKDGGEKLIQRQKGFQMINPTNDWFSGLGKLERCFRSYDWIYGESPKFKVTRLLAAPGDDQAMKLVIEVERGIIRNVRMFLESKKQDAAVCTHFLGEHYSHEVTNCIVAATGCKVIGRKLEVMSGRSFV